jgi:hypothetical protein
MIGNEVRWQHRRGGGYPDCVAGHCEMEGEFAQTEVGERRQLRARVSHET